MNKESREKTRTLSKRWSEESTRTKTYQVRNLDAAINNTKLWEKDKDHIMIKVNLYGKYENISINAMIDCGARRIISIGRYKINIGFSQY